MDVYDRTLDHRINRTQERALRIAYRDYGNNFGFLLEKTKSVPIHVRNLQLLMTEIYKTKFDLNPTFMKDIFMERNISYNLRCGNDAQLPKVWTTSFGIESINPIPFQFSKNELDAGKVINAAAGSARHIFLKWVPNRIDVFIM